MISASTRRLSVFKSVVDSGGFNLASLRLGIAQPSVGAHIKALEAQVGQPLFYRRRGSRPLLTKAGETLYAYAVEVLRKSEEATHTLTNLRDLGAREISLALHRDVAPYMLATQLAAFAARFPKVRMITRTGTIEDVIELARENVVHLAFVWGDGPVAGLQSEVLAHFPLWLVVSPDHPLARRKRVEPSDVMRYPFFTGLRHSRYMKLVNAALKTTGIEEFDIAMELQDSSSVKEMVRFGNGIAALASCAADPEFSAGSLVPLKLALSPPDFELRCVYNAPLTEAAQNFLTELRDRL
jgi:DNA-binding transcriptional LysR family regulator